MPINNELDSMSLHGDLMLYLPGFIVVEHVTRELLLVVCSVCVSVLYPVTAP